MSSADPSLPNDSGEDELSLLMDLVRQSQDAVLLPSGAFLFQEGEPCRGAYYVEQGELELVLTSGERRIPVGWAKPGNLLGMSSVVVGCDYQCSAIAASDAKAIFLSTEIITTYLRQHPETCLITVQMLGSELLDLSSNIIRPMRLQPRYPKQNG